MKLNYALFIFSLMALFLSSCSTPSYFVPAASGNDIAYLPKPMESDSVKTTLAQALLVYLYHIAQEI